MIDLRSHTYLKLGEGFEFKEPDPSGETFFGYVYVGRTRVGFDSKNGLWPVTHWPTPSLAEFEDAYMQLMHEHWGYKIPSRIQVARGRYYDIDIKELTGEQGTAAEGS